MIGVLIVIIDRFVYNTENMLHGFEKKIYYTVSIKKYTNPN